MTRSHFIRRGIYAASSGNSITPIILNASDGTDFFHWGHVNSTFVSNSTDPLGGSTAFTWSSGSVSYASLRSDTGENPLTYNAGVVYGISGYLKIVNGDHDAVHGAFLTIQEDANGSGIAFIGHTFDVVAGTPGVSAVGGDGVLDGRSIVSAGNGWWFCKVWGHFGSTYTSVGGIDAGICDVSTFANAPTGDTSRIQMWNIGQQ